MSHNKTKLGGSKMRFPGIGADAKALDISVCLLWQVLTGRKERQHIMDAYRNLKANQARALLAELETQKAA